MATDLGKVGMRARGDWSSSATYEVMDVVSYNRGLYIAKQAVPANTLPTNTTYWQVALAPQINFIKERLANNVEKTYSVTPGTLIIIARKFNSVGAVYFYDEYGEIATIISGPATLSVTVPTPGIVAVTQSTGYNLYIDVIIPV